MLAVARVAVAWRAAGYGRRERGSQRANGDQKQNEANPSRARTPYSAPLRANTSPDGDEGTPSRFRPLVTRQAWS